MLQYNMARKKIPDTVTSKTTLFRFMQRSYDEAFSLLVFARDFFTMHSKTDKPLLPRDQQLIYTLALSTITTQLTSVMAWLLLCKAIENGEVSAKDIDCEDFAVPVFAPDITHNDSCFSVLNATAKEIMEKSHSIYTRVKRMEESVREQLLEEAR